MVNLTDLARLRMGRIWGPLGAEAAALVERYSTEELELLIDYLRRGRRLLQGQRARLRELDPNS